MSIEYAIVVTTTSNPAEAQKIARALLTQRLAACIQVTPIQSYYSWQGDVNVDDEYQLQIKCKQADFLDIQQCIKANHSYEVPEIIQLPITTGSPEYLQWIDDVIR